MLSLNVDCLFEPDVSMYLLTGNFFLTVLLLISCTLGHIIKCNFCFASSLDAINDDDE